MMAYDSTGPACNVPGPVELSFRFSRWLSCLLCFEFRCSSWFCSIRQEHWLWSAIRLNYRVGHCSCHWCSWVTGCISWLCAGLVPFLVGSGGGVWGLEEQRTLFKFPSVTKLVPTFFVVQNFGLITSWTESESGLCDHWGSFLNSQVWPASFCNMLWGRGSSLSQGGLGL